MLPGLPHLRQRARAGQRPRPRVHRARGARGQAAQSRPARRWSSTSSATCCSSRPTTSPTTSATSTCGSSASSSRSRARSRPRASRTRRSTSTTGWSRSTRSAASPIASASSPRRCTRWLAERAARWPHGAVGDVDARHQAQRGRARAHQRAVRAARRVEAGDVALGARQPPGPLDDRRPVVPEPQRGVPALPDAPRHLAARADDARSRRRSTARASSPTCTRRCAKPRSFTSWLNPSEPHEQAMTRFVETVAGAGQRRVPRGLPRRSQRRVAQCGIYNSLAQLALKIGAPGVPDFYQGTELWDFSLVDPDNRRPVDYERRRTLLRRTGRGASRTATRRRRRTELAATPRDDRMKLYATQHAAALPARAPGALPARRLPRRSTVEGARARARVRVRAHATADAVVRRRRPAAGGDAAADATRRRSASASGATRDRRCPPDGAGVATATC